MTLNLDQELSFAISAVRLATKVCVAVQHRLVEGHTLEKGDKSPVTIADFASQAVTLSQLHERSTVTQYVGEEDADALRQGDSAAMSPTILENVHRVLPDMTLDAMLDAIDLGNHTPDGPDDQYWTLDPIDGTKGFLRGEQYAVALGLIDQGQVVLGVLGCPNLQLQGQAEPGALLTGIRGQGVKVYPLFDDSDPGREGHVSQGQAISNSRFVESVESGHSDQSQSSRIAELLGISSEAVRMDSQCKYAAVADAMAEIYLRLPTRPGYQEKIWDHAAGSLIVEEAGGTVTDIHGRPLDFSQGTTLSGNQGIVATHGPAHDQIIDAIAKTFTLA